MEEPGEVVVATEDDVEEVVVTGSTVEVEDVVATEIVLVVVLVL